MNSQAEHPQTARTLGELPWLCAIPILAVIATMLVEQAAGPRWVRERYDPDYVYLLNGLNIAEGRAPRHTDHPGTPVQCICAAVILARHDLSGEGNLREEVLADPEGCLNAISLVLRGIHAVALVTFGWWAFRFTRSIPLAIAAQTLTVSSVTVIKSLPRVTPEPFLLAIGLFLAAATLRALSRPGPIWTRYAVMSGLLMALGVTAKITFAPVGLVPATLLLARGRHGWRLRIVALFVGAAAALVCVSPILKQLVRMWGWFRALLTGDGHYGGSTGHTFINPETYTTQFTSMLWEEPVLALSTLAGAVMLAVALAMRRAFQSPRVTLALAGAVGAQIAQFVLVAKHPGARYLVPAIAVSGLTLCLSAAVARAALPRLSSRWLALVTASLTCQAAVFVASVLVRKHESLREDTRARVEAWQQSQLLCQGGIVITTYGASSPAYALRFADDWAGRRYGEDIKRLFPRELEYHLWQKDYVQGSGVVPIQQIEDWSRSGLLYVHCAPHTRPEGLDIELLSSAPSAPNVENLYRVKGLIAAAPR